MANIIKKSKASMKISKKIDWHWVLITILVLGSLMIYGNERIKAIYKPNLPFTIIDESTTSKITCENADHTNYLTKDDLIICKVSICDQKDSKPSHYRVKFIPRYLSPSDKKEVETDYWDLEVLDMSNNCSVYSLGFPMTILGDFLLDIDLYSRDKLGLYSSYSSYIRHSITSITKDEAKKRENDKLNLRFLLLSALLFTGIIAMNNLKELISKYK